MANEQNDNSPLWQHVTVFDKKSEGRGNRRFRCNFCNGEYSGSYSRVKAHLLKISGFGIRRCPKVSDDVHRELMVQMEEVDRRNRLVQVPLGHQSFSSAGSVSGSTTPTHGGSVSGSSSQPSTYQMMLKNVESKKRKTVTTKGPLDLAFQNEVRENLNSYIARMFYSGGLPFHFARNPYYLKVISYAANNNFGGYIPPGYNSLRTTLLQKERANIDRLLQPIKDTWSEKGMSIVTDGWTDIQRRPIINFMAVTESGPIFLKAINCEGEYKDKFFIAKLIKEVIVEVGAQNVVQVITDNAPVCKAAGAIIESQYSHIFWTPCVVHTLNLALKNICNPNPPRSSSAYDPTYEQCKWITEVYEDAVFVKNFIMNHAMRLAMFNEFVNLKLLSVAETRFASVIVMLKRFKLIKTGLQSMVISNSWTTYRDDDPEKAQVIKQRLLNDLWWDKITYILEFTRPIYDMLRFADTDKPALHLIYDMWDTMIEKVKEVIYRHERITQSDTSEFYQVIYDILISRWTKSTSPLHCLAHSLNPRYYSKDWLDKESNRVPPHKDEEISDERNKCMRRFFPDPEERKKANLEFARFSGATDSFASFDSLNDRGTFDARSWWMIYGSSAPMLQNIALKLLCQPCSSSCAERNWSTYSFIHSMRRNRILPERAEDLVYVHTNLRLLSRKQEQYNEGESRLWDVCGDAFDPLDGAGELEIASLSLDEPELENVLFTDDINEEI